MSSNTSNTNKTRLFISYAVEDSVVASWVARKLLCCGYSIWIDKMFLRGGCTWPNDIDVAIKNQSIRMIHLMSPYSLVKPNPTAERTLGLELAKEIPYFLIPLNLGVPSRDIPWQLKSIQYIDFSDWGKGFAALLKTLEEDKIPKEFATTGLGIALKTYNVKDAILPDPEPVYSNAFKLVAEPSQLCVFTSEHSLLRTELITQACQYHWPTFFVNPHTSISYFDPPKKLAAMFRISKTANCETSASDILGIKTINIRKNLLARSVREGAIQEGFKSDKNILLFPDFEPTRARYPYVTWWGEKTNMAPHGFKTVGGKKWYYTIGFMPRIMLIMEKLHCVLSLHLGLTNEEGKPIDPDHIPAVRKSIMKSWWNDKISKIHCAIASRLCNGEEAFGYSVQNGPKVLFSSFPVVGYSPTTINEVVIDEIAKQRNTKTFGDFKADAKQERGAL